MLVKYIRDNGKLVGCVVGLEPGKIGVSICHDKPTVTMGGVPVKIVARHGKDVCILMNNNLFTVRRKNLKIQRDTFSKKEARDIAISQANGDHQLNIPNRDIFRGYVNVYETLGDVIREETEHMEQRLQKPKSATVPKSVKPEGYLTNLLKLFM